MSNPFKQLRRILARLCTYAPDTRCFPLILGLLLTVPAGLSAQEEEPATLDHLPRVRHLAAALSDSDSRLDTMFTMVAVAQLLRNAGALEPGQTEAATERFRDDRTWLDQLSSRYVEVPMRSTVLDPSAWHIGRELAEHEFDPPALVSPLGPELDVLLQQLFDRSEPRLAAALLPEVLARVGALAPGLWRSLRETAATNENLLAVVAGLSTDWFDPWTAAEPPAPLSLDGDPLETARAMLASLADTATLPGPPDELALKRIRFTLLTAETGDDPWQRAQVDYVLRLATGIENLRRHHYLSFLEGLLWVASDILARAAAGEAASPTATMLSELLPRISSSFAREFSRVDPRINAGLAAVYDVVQNLRGGTPAASRINQFSLELADAVAQIALLMPDMDFYFGQPVRNLISEEVEICTTLAAAQTGEGERALTREQFNRCMQAMVNLVERQARSSELSGDADGPFGTQHLARELSLPPWQRINYVLGYMHDSFAAMCQFPKEPLPNPLEWANLATLMAWFADRAPVYLQTPGSEALIMRMRQHGLDLLAELSRQADCFSGAGGGMNDPVSRSIQDYDAAMLDLINGIRQAELAFRAERLKPGADVVLGGGFNQRTSYRSEDLLITACNPERACGMTDTLGATRALVGLFPDPYLIADQSGLGDIEICYDNVRWLNRRSQPVRKDDPFVADYYGHLAFDLKGRYVESGSRVDVFGGRFVSPDEYHYLFAAQDEEILADPCPLEHVGKRVHASLAKERRFRIVPDRLTYLASVRVRPSDILADNWGRGAEWRDWFVTGIGVTALEFDGDPAINDRVSQHLQSLYQAQQSMVYSALLRPGLSANAPAGASDLYGLMQIVDNRKAVIRSIVSLFYAAQLLDSDSIRSALVGHAGLLDEEVLGRFRDANVPVSTIGERGLLRLEEFRGDWSRLPEDVRRSGSVGNSVSHALTRLNALYREHFGLTAEAARGRATQL